MQAVQLFALQASALVAAFCAISDVNARPLDAIGNCPQNASITLAQGPYHGEAKALLNISAFAGPHATATANELEAVQKLRWKSGLNREFRSGATSIIVATICNPADCEHNRAYIAFSPVQNFYGGSFYEGQHVRDYGIAQTEPVYDVSLGPAITCAQNLDWQREKAK